MGEQSLARSHSRAVRTCRGGGERASEGPQEGRGKREKRGVDLAVVAPTRLEMVLGRGGPPAAGVLSGGGGGGGEQGQKEEEKEKRNVPFRGGGKEDPTAEENGGDSQEEIRRLFTVLQSKGMDFQACGCGVR